MAIRRLPESIGMKTVKKYRKASSAESVGRFWFREPSQVMI
jgi:hypothetical protein